LFVACCSTKSVCKLTNAKATKGKQLKSSFEITSNVKVLGRFWWQCQRRWSHEIRRKLPPEM